MDCYIVQFTDTEQKKTTTDELEMLDQSLESLFYFCITWSFGATGDYQSRENYNIFLSNIIVSRNKNSILPADMNWYESFYDISSKGFQLWSTKYSEYQVDNKLAYHEIMIPTADSTRNIYLLKLLLENNKHVMNPGPTGTGKT